MAVTTRTYEQVALEEPTAGWELVDGDLRRKPPMTMEHYDLAFELAFAIRSQVSHAEYHVRCDQSRLRSGPSYLIPDVFVVPAALVEQFRGRNDVLEAYSEPLPFVAEVWSPSTGDYDVTTKLAAYQARGDAEVWLLNPYEPRLTAWVRQPDGSYASPVHAGGRIALSAIAGVIIDLDKLFGRE
ncbi:MAG: Uma2 family endonuclease [Dehalococcoidia bacterium]|nr:Uma2 family endonuclease [Dehalococcoidia bacterium]